MITLEKQQANSPVIVMQKEAAPPGQAQERPSHLEVGGIEHVNDLFPRQGQLIDCLPH
jgi:hypothetical protein